MGEALRLLTKNSINDSIDTAQQQCHVMISGGDKGLAENREEVDDSIATANLASEISKHIKPLDQTTSAASIKKRITCCMN